MLLMKNNQHCGSNINSDLHQAVSHHPLHYLCLISNPITWAGVYIIKRSRFVSLCNDLWTPLYSLCALVGSSTLEVNICCSLKSRFGRSNTVNLKHSLLIRSLVYFAGGKPPLPAKKNLWHSNPAGQLQLVQLGAQTWNVHVGEIVAI